jgi:hypothetical protein
MRHSHLSGEIIGLAGVALGTIVPVGFPMIFGVAAMAGYLEQLK